MEYNVFISHSSIDEAQVKPICAYLEDKGLKCFVSYRDIPSGVSYPGAITRAMRESEMLLLVLSKDSNESTQVDRELTLANDQKKKMSCFRLEDIAYSDDKAYLMSGVNWLDAFPNPESCYFVLLQDICRQLGREVPLEEETEEARQKRYAIRLGKLLTSASNGNSNAQFDLSRAYNSGELGLNIDVEEAYRWLLKAAKKGHIEAENSLGVFYATGRYVQTDLTEAIKWYRIAALSGNEVAQANLGTKYYFGEGVERNLKQAVKWWTLAADQGFDNAQVRLGNCFYYGEGVEQNYEKAVELYTRAAEQDNDWAQTRLAECYREGKGVEQNIRKCIELLETASNNNCTDAMIELARIYDFGINIEPSPEIAFKFIKMAADKSNAVGLWNLSRCYRDGIGCEQNYKTYFQYLCQAAENGHNKAQDTLGDIYAYGNEELGIAIDAEKAKYWYEKAIEDNYPDAMVDLGLCYSVGGCLPLDDTKAAELFRMAAEQEDSRGQYFLSDEYQQGDGVEQNDVEAFNWCKKSAEQCYPPAMGRLGEYYYYGFGVEQDFDKAVEWLTKASNEGVEDAQYHLGICYENGYSVDKNLGEAFSLYCKSAGLGCQKAKESKERLKITLTEYASKGDNDALYSLGQHYINGEEDANKGLSMLIQSAEQGHVQAQCYLGNIYSEGMVIPKDMEKAYAWWQKAGDYGNPWGYNNYAWHLHLEGKYEEALPWAEKAMNNTTDEPEITDTLAVVYQGLGRYDEAMEKFELCIKLKQAQDFDEKSIEETKNKIAELKKLMNQ